jgi:hypothetical protein
VCREVDNRVYDIWPYYQEGKTCLHIGHLVSLELSNFASLLGSSGVVIWVTNPLENDCENANTLAHDVVHLVGLALLQRGSCWVYLDQLGEVEKKRRRKEQVGLSEGRKTQPNLWPTRSPAWGWHHPFWCAPDGLGWWHRHPLQRAQKQHHPFVFWA